MDKQDIKDLMEQFDKSSLTKLKLKETNFELSFSKEIKFDASNINSSQLVQFSPNTVPMSINAVVDVEAEKQDNIVEIKSPMVGTFYASGEQGGKPFVEIGDQVKKGQIVCIIEAMKTMNEIPAPVDGKVVSIEAADGELMGFDSLLITLEIE